MKDLRYGCHVPLTIFYRHDNKMAFISARSSPGILN